MTLLNDIKQDVHFKKSINIIGMGLVLFFTCDILIGLFLTNGLYKYYGLGTDAEIALVGHSHLMLGIDKTLLQIELGIPVAKYTREGVNIADRQMMVKQLILKNPKLKTLVYGVDAWSFTGEGLSDNSYVLFYPFMGDKDINKYIKEQAETGNYWIHKLLKTSRFDESLISSSFRGYLNNWTNLKYGEVDTVRLKEQIKAGDFRRINNSTVNIELLKETIRELNRKNINVILLYVPTIDVYNQAEPKKFTETLEIFKQMADEFENVSFLNYLEPYSHDYSLFFDQIHMNPKGQELITKRLIQDLKEEFLN